MDNLTRDLALFKGTTAEDRTEAMRDALELLMAAGWTAPFQFDPVKAISVWADQLRDLPGNVVRVAAKRWIETEQGFPSLPQFEAKARQVYREHMSSQPAGQSGADYVPAPTDCTECGGDGWVSVVTPQERVEILREVPPDARRRGDLRAYTYSEPCSTCSPVMWDAWRNGHLRPDHNRSACCHDHCAQSTKGRKRPG